VPLTFDPKGSSKDNGRPRDFGWRDFLDISIKWRQVSEPNDPVFWIDLLAPEAFAEGFGLQTPMVTGQMNVVRYYPYFSRALEVVKKLVADSGTVFFNIFFIFYFLFFIFYLIFYFYHSLLCSDDLVVARSATVSHPRTSFDHDYGHLSVCACEKGLGFRVRGSEFRFVHLECGAQL
jgi:hypothetical protein